MQVALYADFAPDQILEFLRFSNFVLLQQAYNECEQRPKPL